MYRVRKEIDLFGWVKDGELGGRKDRGGNEVERVLLLVVVVRNNVGNGFVDKM